MQNYAIMSHRITHFSSSAMVEVVSHRPLTTDAWVRVWVSPSGTCVGQSSTATGFSPNSSVFPSHLSFHNGSPCSYITSGINNRATGGHSSETQSNPSDINYNNLLWHIYSSSQEEKMFILTHTLKSQRTLTISFLVMWLKQ
jgi:hypothetical protein